jgi:hypothetical protein
MGVQLSSAAAILLRMWLPVSVLVVVFAACLAILYLPALVLVHGPRGMLAYSQFIVLGLVILQSWPVKRREHRAVDRGLALVYSGFVVSNIVSLLTNWYLIPESVIVVVDGLCFTSTAIGAGLMLRSSILNRRAAKRRERRALIARLTQSLQSRLPR